MLLLVDYSSMLYRAWHSTPSSVRTHAVHGFFGMLARVMGDRHPSGLAVCVDEDWRPAFRVEALPTYKTQRLDGGEGTDDGIERQLAIGRHLLSALGVAVAGAPGFEAEDVIATLAARTQDEVEILSGDRDLFALVRDPRVRVLYPVKGVRDLAVVDESEIERRYGIPGRCYLDFALLRGDPSDGLPGVPGVGEKTAARLIREHGSLERLRRATGLAPSLARKLEEARDYLDAAVRVVAPVQDVPLPPGLDPSLPPHRADERAYETLAREHGLEGAVKRLLRAFEGT